MKMHRCYTIKYISSTSEILEKGTFQGQGMSQVFTEKEVLIEYQTKTNKETKMPTITITNTNNKREMGVQQVC